MLLFNFLRKVPKEFRRCKFFIFQLLIARVKEMILAHPAVRSNLFHSLLRKCLDSIAAIVAGFRRLVVRIDGYRSADVDSFQYS